MRAAALAAVLTAAVAVATSAITGGLAGPTPAAAAPPVHAAAAPVALPAAAIPAAAPRPAPARAAVPAVARPPASTPAGSKPGGGAPPAPVAVDGTPCTSTAKACVDIADHQAWLFQAGSVLRGPVPVMTGDQDDPTPVGTFHVQWKAQEYTSRQYLVQMPYSVFFADGGVAFHEGRQDTPSAGCVKLGHDDAVAFFGYLQVGDEVQVHSGPT